MHEWFWGKKWFFCVKDMSTTPQLRLLPSSDLACTSPVVIAVICQHKPNNFGMKMTVLKTSGLAISTWVYHCSVSCGRIVLRAAFNESCLKYPVMYVLVPAEIFTVTNVMFYACRTWKTSPSCSRASILSEMLRWWNELWTRSVWNRQNMRYELLPLSSIVCFLC